MYEGTITVSCHPELPPGIVVRSKVMDQELGFTWLEVELTSGIKRHVIVKDIKQLGEDNGKL